MNTRFVFAGFIIALLAGGLAIAETAIELKAVPGSVRVRQDQPFEGQDEAVIACARGEYESFQVVVTARGSLLKPCVAGMSALRSEGAAEIAEPNITLYRVAYVPVRFSSPGATCPPGLTPDPLVPFKNPYTGEDVAQPVWRENGREGGRFGGNGFEVWPDQHQPVWVDVFVPRETPPGVYAGLFTVHAGDQRAELPVELTVWGFTLPEGPTHENHFGGFERVAAYHRVEPGSEAFDLIEDRYIAVLAEHRINPPIPRRLWPRVADDGAAIFDEVTDAAITEFVNRYHVSNIDVPRAPFGDALGVDRDKALRFYRSWYDYLERKGWARRAYVYMLDEPNDPEAYERVRRLGALVNEAAPGLRRLVVEQPYTQDPAWGTLDGALDIWCPLFGFVHEPSVQRVIAQGDDVWSYTALVQKAPPYHPEYESVKGDLPPFWQVDYPVTSYRIPAWLNRRYGITGLLYWSTVYWGSPDRNPWDDPGFRIRWNGDGALFYPGADAGIEGPVASIRLKNLRDGMEDYEYFALLEARGGGEAVEQIVRAAVPTWGSWQQDPYRLIELRARLAGEILQRAPTAMESLPR